MKQTLSTLSVAAILITTMLTSAVSLANEEKEISVFVKKVNDSDATVDLSVNGDASVFKLPQLDDGASTTVTTDNGKVYTVKRNGEHYTITLDDGEVIDLPMGGNQQLAAKVISLHGEHSIDNKNVITIMGGDLTPDQMETIKASIAAAGITKEVKFAKGFSTVFIGEGDHSVIDLKNGNVELEWSTDADVKVIESKDGKHVKHVIVKKEESKN